MNKAVTDGLVLTPPEFAGGLTVWSRGDGTAGTPTYDGAADAALIAADQDFGGCLELQKTETTQTLRYMGETTILPGCYLQVRARVKAISGAFPTVRVAAYAGQLGGAAVPGVVTTGPSVTLDTYGEVVTITAIVGTGSRTGVDMAWGTSAAFGHFGIDLTGPDGGVIRVDDIEITDVTYFFHRKMMDWVDVKDFGAAGDGVTDDSAAFLAADLAAQGREVLVPAGTFNLAESVTLTTQARFEGTITMPDDKVLALTKNFDLPTYIDAFGDEVLGFKKAFQALMNFSDHDSLDMGGRRVELDGPLVLQATVANQSSFQIRRVLRNGQINLTSSANWDDVQVTSSASYSAGNPDTLTAVANVANVPIGALVTGVGVGREVYVLDINIGAATLTLSQPLYAAAGTQTYTFTRFQYALDFSGFTVLDKFEMESMEIQCNGFGSAILLPPAGKLFQMRDCSVTKPKDRGVTSHGLGCQGLHMDRCQFTSNEQSVAATARVSIALNVNANDVKVRGSRFSRFRHTAVVHGGGHLISGNHWFQGDEVTDGARLGGLIFTQTNVKSAVVGNYIDNSSIEWTNEHDAAPEFSSEFSFGGLTISGNIFTANDVASFFNWIAIKPHGPGHFVNGLNISGNVFKSLNGSIDRIETVDSSIAPLDMTRMRRIQIEGNTFNSVTYPVANPATENFTIGSAQSVWSLGFGDLFPFGGHARRVVSITADGQITNAAAGAHWDQPFATSGTGANNDEVQLTWSEPVSGKVTVTARIDNPN
jgi:hypothetical protein